MLKVFIIELKNRFLLSIYSWVCTAVTCYSYKENVVFLIAKPGINSYTTKNFYFLFTDLSEPFYTYLKVVMFISNQSLYIYTIYQIIVFLSPGLYMSEYINLIKKFSWGLAIISVYTYGIYCYILPWSWEFFLDVEKSKNMVFFFEAKISEYLDFVLTIYYLMIAKIVILVVLINAIMLQSNLKESLKKLRKPILVIFLITSSLITPPDIISQLVLTAILCSMFEIMIYKLIVSYSLKTKLRKPIETN